MIGTHNSFTSLQGEGLLSLLVTPFARTQSKGIREQWDAGCRYFDIRLKQIKGEWKIAHGLWHSKMEAWEVLRELNLIGECYATIMYEGSADEETLKDFADFVEIIQKTLRNINIQSVAVKKPFRYLSTNHTVKTKDEYVVLDGRSWHTYLPIPWLWAKTYWSSHNTDLETYTIVDFI